MLSRGGSWLRNMCTTPYHHQHSHHHRKSTLSAHLQVVIARCHAFIENGISMETNLWSLVTQELMVSGFFRKYFFRSFTPPFLSQDFFSFPSLYETSLNDHEPSIANDLRETHTKWVLKKAEFVSCRYFPFTQSSGTTTSWCCNSSSSTLKISRPQKVTTSIILNHLKWW